jgi:glycosyltransferase involved in cell wall biosynthesis/ribosomal protein S18 acetylase RimI-like enzyme
MASAKVVYLITGLYVGGAEKLLLHHVRCLDRRRFEPLVVTLRGGDLVEEFSAAGVRVVDLAMRSALDIGAVLRLRALIQRERPQILHTHLFHADLLGRLVGAWCRVPAVITTLHMLEAAQHRWWCDPINRAGSRANAAMLAVSEEVKRGFVQGQGLAAEKIRVLPNAVEPLRRVTDEERARVRRGLGVPEGGQLIGIVGRLEAPRKGHTVLFEALARILPHWPHLRCVVVGDGPERAEIEAKARALKLESRVVFTGMHSDVAPWLAASDVFVLPSLEEGQPMALIEAMGAGCAIVATPVGGVAEMLDDGVHGLLVPPSNAEALAAAIERHLRAPIQARTMGAAAQARFAERYDMRRLIASLEACYDEALAPRPITLLELVTTLDPGGVTTCLVNLVRGLPSHRFRVIVGCGPDALQQELLGQLPVPVRVIPGLQKAIHPLRDLAALWRLCRLIRRERVDMVHSNMSKADLLGGLAARLCGVRCLISTCHGPLRLTRDESPTQRVFDALEWLMYRTLHDTIISVSEFTTQELIRKGKARAEQVTTIPNAIDASRLDRPGVRDAVRAGLGLSPAQPVLVMVARLREPKTPEVLIESVRRLREDWPELVCLFVGDGPQEAALQQQIARDGLQPAVRLLGRRGDVPDLLAASDVFVLSTYSEGMSISVLEAMAAGLPVIASRVGGMEELVQPERTGVLVPPHDPEVLSGAIRRLLADPVGRRQMGAAARARIAEEFSVERHAERTRAALEHAWAQRRGRGASATDPSALERLRRHLREEGVGGTLARLANQALGRLYASECYWKLERPMDRPIPRLAPKIPCAVRQATLDDLDRLAAVSLCSRAELERQLRSPHDACFIAERDGAVLAQQWVAVGPCPHDVAPLPWPAQLRPDEAYFYATRAMKAVRGQGLAPALCAEALRWLDERGVRVVYTLVRERNAASIRMLQKVGFSQAERVRLRRSLFGVAVVSERLVDGRLIPDVGRHWRLDAQGQAWFADRVATVPSAAASPSMATPHTIPAAEVSVR